MAIRTFSLSMLAIATMASTAVLAESHGGGAHFLLNWDLDEDGQVTEAEIRERRDDVFYMFDEDENGVLEPAEYDEFDAVRAADMEANGMADNPQAPGHGMRREFNDADGDGKVTHAEFLDGSAGWLQSLDKTGDGVVTKADLKGLKH